MERGETSHRLREAVILNDLSMVKRLLKQQPTLLQNPDFEDKSNTSLHLAAKYGHDEVAVSCAENQETTDSDLTTHRNTSYPSDTTSHAIPMPQRTSTAHT